MFRCLPLAYDALREGGTLPAVLNAANEIAVQVFFHDPISFMDIPRIIPGSMEAHVNHVRPDLGAIIDADRSAREFSARLVNSEPKQYLFISS